MIYGETENIRNSVLDKLEQIYEFKEPKEELLSKQLYITLIELSSLINKEISVAVNRKGQVEAVAVGDSTTVEMPLIPVSVKKMSGIRIIHTHPNGTSKLSALDISALIQYKLDAIVALAILEGKGADVSVGVCSLYEERIGSEIYSFANIDKAEEFDYLEKVLFLEKQLKVTDVEEDIEERAFLVGVDNEDSLVELGELAKACGILTKGSFLQKRSRADSAYFIGKGKAEEISMYCQAQHVNLLIFDDELSASQVRNLENLTGVKVIDRTILILEIFASRARSKEAKIQVELAQLKYRLPRLSGLGIMLDRTGGGIGTRGPGEKKLETDRRHIKERIYELARELEKIKGNRQTQSERRRSSTIPQISLVGYTNVGKSTLRNLLWRKSLKFTPQEGKEVLEADMLFATLDTTIRNITLLDGREATLTDTIGFVNKLPHDLVEAFKSTLEEVIEADLLVHVIDVSSSSALLQLETVNRLLLDLKVKDTPVLLALNKIDKANEEVLKKITLENISYPQVKISAKKEINIEELLLKMAGLLPNTRRVADFLIPYNVDNLRALLHNEGRILSEEFKEEGTFIKAEVTDIIYNKLEDYLV